jgi:two-component system cell cycle sensor histidine kinase/response regulator CckA
MGRRRVGAGPGAFELAEIERAAERATQLTRQLLAFSRRQVLQPVALDLNEATNALMPMLTRLIGEDIEIVVFAAEELPAVLADRTQIEQVIINLAVNARDAMPSGGTLTLETRAMALTEGYAGRHAHVKPGDYVCLTVTDSGDGIDPATLEHIFEPFYTTKDNGRGTGLGLATVHGIVAQSGGHIQVYTEPGLGATFKVYLPAGPSDAAKPQPSAQIARKGLEGSETVLLCEDEEGVLRLVERILTAEGYAVLAAATPREAIALAAEYGDTIDVLVTDIVMPGMSGPELAAELQRAQPGLRILMLSGYTAETAHSRGDLPLGSRFVEKPFERIALLRVLRDLLDQPTGPAPDASERTRRDDA